MLKRIDLWLVIYYACKLTGIITKTKSLGFDE